MSHCLVQGIGVYRGTNGNGKSLRGLLHPAGSRAHDYPPTPPLLIQIPTLIYYSSVLGGVVFGSGRVVWGKGRFPKNEVPPSYAPKPNIPTIVPQPKTSIILLTNLQNM